MLEPANLDEVKRSLRKEIMSGLTKNFAENQKEQVKLRARTAEKTSNQQHFRDSDSEAEDTFIAPTSTTIKT